MNKRGSGILLHITSLPSAYGIGDLGPQAYSFVDFLAGAKQSYWQVLPLNPTSQVMGHSPYSGLSAFAGNTLLISPQLLYQDGLLGRKDIEESAGSSGRCDYIRAYRVKQRLFARAYALFKRKPRQEGDEYEWFNREHEYWLKDYLLFTAIRGHYKKKLWSRWPRELKDRDEKTLGCFLEKYIDKVEQERFLQYIFFKQWSGLKEYCSNKKVQIIGDIPIYVSYDSAEVWAHAGIFKLDEEKRPTRVAGVPPDYFSKTGQLWGNPVYRWDILAKAGFEWWMKRMGHNLNLFDLVRIDHFRGLVSYWEVSASEKTAVNGQWVAGPADSFFTALRKHLPDLPIIAEDLGMITEDVKELIKRFNIPGMKVLLFAFGEDNPTHPYLPHMYERNCIVYTGTHDNNTIRGWFASEAGPKHKKRLFSYVGRKVKAKILHWELIRLAMSSVAAIAIFPMQDILGLGRQARMNIPSTATGNWRWRMSKSAICPQLTKRLLQMTQMYARASD